MTRELSGIIEAKIRIPPEREGLLRRTSIVDDLEHSHAPLVLVQAPAGYGKSTILEQWAHRGDRRFAWVSLDPSESDPTLFWRHLYAALRVCIPGFAQHLHREMAKPGPDLTTSVIPGILNELERVEEPLVVVLDDYHRIDSEDVDRTVRLLVRHLPQGVALAIGTRTRPNLEVARLRSRGLIHEVDASDLDMTLAETASVLRAQNPERTDEEAAWIHAQTEGWPAGVYLFGLVDSVDAAVATTSVIRDYLITEMLSSHTDDDLRFMRETAILSHLEAGSCDQVTQRDSGQSTLERLAASNLLIIPLDDVGEQYRYHHLLQAELSSRLEREEPAEVVASLHRRAMEWTADHGEISEAIHHAVQAGETEHAVTLVADHWYEYTMTGRVQSAYHWLSQFSDSDLRTRPRLMLAGAMLAAFSNHPHEARELAARAQAASSRSEGFAGAATYDSSVAIMRASMAADGPVAALADARHAAEIEPLESPYRPLLAAMVGTFVYSTAVHDAEAYPLLLEGSRAATGPPETAAYALANLALMHAWRNDADAALSYARQAIQRIDETNVGGLLVYGPPYAIAARFSVTREGLAACNLLMRSAEQAERTASNAAPFDSMVLRTTMAEAYV
ncbi:MAG: hypothetical protein QNJ71_11655, partial [Acidimicrobiia bacterium]|nr:hypothetical protein [Acidimicrobiia bacterium]